VGTAKRERKKANRAAKIEREIRQERVASVKRRTLRWGGVVAGGIAVVIVIAWIGGAFSGDETASTTTVATTPDGTGESVDTDTDTEGAADADWPGDPADCPPVDGSGTAQRNFDAYPPKCITDGVSYTAEIVTNKGSLTVQLDAERAPKAVNSFVTLARHKYFDATECHRIIPGFVVQCGDPTATGTGGPGYSFEDELPAAGEYRIGSLAMANSGPDTNGSQFFIISGDRGAALPPNYTLFGEVIEGLDDTLVALDAAGNPESNGVPPLEQVTIVSVTISES
jgi:cyclophilin family peptidyl-prolyl cis-trans isomerase